jgi:deoxyribonuclease-4
MVYPNTFDKLHIGPSGNPAEAPLNEGSGAVVEWCADQGWDCFELAFVHQVYLSEKEAEKVAAASAKRGVAISCHGSYYVNMASKEKKKVDDSRPRIVQAARRIQQAGGHSVVYHSAFNEDRDSAEVTALVIEQTKLVEAELKAKDIRVWLRPELTGKPVQHGSIEELIKVCNAVESALPCIDWAHQHARFGGGWNSYDEWCELLDKLASGIRNKNVLQRMHMHVSGIEYGPKGEKKHLPLVTSDLRYKELMQALKQAGVCGTLVVEAPRECLVEDVDRFRDAWEKA